MKKNDLIKQDKDDIIRLICQTIISIHTRFFNRKQNVDKYSENKLIRLVNNNIRVTRHFNKESIMPKITATDFPRNIRNLAQYFEDNNSNNSDENNLMLTESSTEYKHNYQGIIVKTTTHQIPQYASSAILEY